MRLRVIAVGLALAALVAFGQTDRGSITGTILDPAGAVVPGAAISVKNSDTGAVFAGGTSATGNYVVSVPAGKYELTITVPGFKKYVRSNLSVIVATDTRQDVTLEVGAATETVTVEDSVPILKTESGEVSHNVTANDADNLPVLTLSGSQSFFSNGFGNIRDPLAVSQLIPGVVYGNDAGLSVNGLPASTEAIRIEGQDATNGMWNQVTQINQSGMDAIQEVSIQTSNFAAEFGQAGGGYFNYTMKSGTNQFHGSAYTYFTNEALNAGLPFTDAGLTNSNKSGQHIRNVNRKFDFGGSVGGPVKLGKLYNGQDRTFFFFQAERYQETQSFTKQLTVPTEAYRNGDFSRAALFPVGVDALGRPMFLDQIYDPLTTRPGPGGVTIRDPFSGGIIPRSPDRLDPVALAIQKLIPEPNAAPGPFGPLSLNNYNQPTYTDYKHTTNWSVKMDHSFSSNVKVSGYLSRILTFQPNANGLSGPIAQPAPTDNKSTTVRVNYDQTIRPTLLLHMGIGYLQTYDPSHAPPFDQTALGLHGYPDSKHFPNLTGLYDFFSGGVNISGTPFGGGAVGPGGFFTDIWDQKPTANTSLTWVKGNHTFKFGGEMMIEGFPSRGPDATSGYRANGIFNIAATSTGNPNEHDLGLQTPITTGFGYASFLLGQVDNLNINPPTQNRLGNHSLAFFVQDSWKVTRKLTLDYGLRYDFETYLKEQYGRMPSASYTTINPNIGLPGAVVFEGYGAGHCNCDLSHNYPYAFGPRLGVAYQIDTKTVFRGGVGVQYDKAPNNAFLSYNVPAFYSLSGPGYGIPFMSNMTSGNPFAPGNPQNLAPLVYPNLDEGLYPTKTGLGYVPQSPFIHLDRSSRPPRIFTWSIGLQREITSNFVVEASYVGNRGVWWTAPELSIADYNAVQPSYYSKFGLDFSNAADRGLLLLPISSPQVIARFPKLADPNTVYKGFPNNQTLAQALRPVPQWNSGTPPFLGPPLGDTWYDSLQVKATKRYSHGLQMQGSFVWSKNEVLGTSAATQYFTPGTPLVNDVYNRMQNKQLSQLGGPLALVISGSYLTPRAGSSRLLKNVLGGWQVGALLRYQSGALIQTPPSSNNLLTQLDRGPENNPALWGGGHTFWNPVQGQSCLGIDPNQKGYDPTKVLALNPKAWTEAAGGQFGVSAPFYNNCRWQRKPQESMNFGRNFRIREGMNLQIRAEFFNVFNRLFYSAPAVGGFGVVNPSTPAQNTNPNGGLSSGYGFVNYINGAGDTPRSAQIVARFTF